MAGDELRGGRAGQPFSRKARRKIVLAMAEAYRSAMRGFAEQPFLDVWYAHLDVEQTIRQFRSQITTKFAAAQHPLRKVTTLVEGRRRIVSDPRAGRKRPPKSERTRWQVPSVQHTDPRDG